MLSENLKKMKVALVHDWLIHMRGGEKVLDGLVELFPDAVIYTLFYDKKELSTNLQRSTIRASFLQYFPGIKHYYRWLLPILPWVIKTLRIKDVDLVISSSHCVAKGITMPQNAFHICYCHTPMRYLWGFQDIYFNRYWLPVRLLIRLVFHFLRKADLSSNQNVNLFISNSEYIRERIQRVYQRDAVVVHPPLETDFFNLNEMPRASNYYLAVSHFVPYKRIDIVIEAFNLLKRRLIIIGSGPLERHYKKLRKSEQISFLGSVNNSELRKAYQGAQALIFPAEEDFGIVPLEAQACGTPVIAFRKGGALETIKSGVFFDTQTPAAVQEAVLRFEAQSFDPEDVAKKVRYFNRKHFLENLKRTLLDYYSKRERET